MNWEQYVNERLDQVERRSRILLVMVSVLCATLLAAGILGVCHG